MTCLGFLGAVQAACAQQFNFDIPAQRLSSALDRFADISHQSVLYRDDLVDGRMSSAVRGQYSPTVALRLLLEGSGLVADDVRTSSGGGLPEGGTARGSGAFVLTPGAAHSTDPTAAGLDRSYDGLVQTRVWQTLCLDSRTAPGSYRALLRVQVDSAGTVRRLRLLASTGDANRDAAMLAVLSGLPIGYPPPPGLAQPITLMILPLNAIAQARACQGER
ncbi:hypothetical protein RO07_21385 [Pandoraea pulmonicola]|nr:hypothetical protein RO07_21385 [Pandoraea pulmonicola]